MLFTFRTLALVCLHGLLVGCSDLSGKQVSSKDYPGTRHLQRSYSLMGDSHLLSSVIRDSGSSDNSCNDDLACLMFASNDRHGLEAIRSLHRQLDDDANGAVDLSESDDFLREELQYETGAERRQKAFHRNDDMHISVKELWEAWVRSEVHNWTVEQTTDWLSNNVGLPQYVPIFIYNNVNGATLPRLAVNNMQYLNNVLGIKDPIHKQKLALKAMDVVLFGPPKEHKNHIKDTILVIFLVGAVVGFWYAYRINKSSRTHLQRMMKDMESLQNAAFTLETLQKELEQARQEQQCATTEKQDLERKLMEQSAESGDLRTSYSDLEVSQLKAEIEVLRNELQRAEGELEDRCWSPPVGLQQWLQLTHELENKAYVKKRLSAEKQLQAAREACEKLRKKRSSLVGAFVSTHGKSIDDVDRSIVEARTLLNEVTQELAERVYRWKQIELLCGFNIINNSGLAVLESVLYKNTANGRGFGAKGRLSSQDDLFDEDNLSLPSGMDSVIGGADSSESEKFDGDDDGMSSAGFALASSHVGGSVEFIVGDSDDQTKPRKLNTLSPYNTGPHFPLSRSQEFQGDTMETDSGVQLSHSDSNLDAPFVPTPAARHRKPLSIRSEPSTTGSILFEEEGFSTDSNSTAADDPVFALSEKSHKKTKLRFPKFTRKSRHTPPPEKHT